jgi:periplasmic divalent cation tolerance protein
MGEVFNMNSDSSQSKSSAAESRTEIVVFVTAPSMEQAEKIARSVVESGLAACANIFSPINSIYMWEQKMSEDSEVLMILKTKSNLFDPLAEAVKRLHTYQIPEIIALPIVKATEDYLNWMTANTRKA